jgi:hypothetical protein
MTIAQIIDNAKDAQFACLAAIQRGGVLGAGLSQKTTRLIYYTRKAVERVFDLDANEDTLTGTSNYLQAISIMYWQPNKNTDGMLGSGTAPIVTGNILPTPYDFEVTGGSFIIAGQSQKTINAFIGYNVTFNRNNIPQSQVDLGGGSSYYTWNPNTGNFQIFPAAATGELFTITPV